MALQGNLSRFRGRAKKGAKVDNDEARALYEANPDVSEVLERAVFDLLGEPTGDIQPGDTERIMLIGSTLIHLGVTLMATIFAVSGSTRTGYGVWVNGMLSRIKESYLEEYTQAQKQAGRIDPTLPDLPDDSLIH